jgi:tripartite-type tricarboxylate transporter receptor subunit TctC
MRLLFAVTLALLAAPVIAADAARGYPSRPVRVINPFPPGGNGLMTRTGREG